MERKELTAIEKRDGTKENRKRKINGIGMAHHDGMKILVSICV
jgi:hypothetical protein